MNRNLKLYDGQSAPEFSLVRGAIDICENRYVFGWIYSPVHDLKPVLMCNGIPLRCIASDIAREDVKEAIGTNKSEVGFQFQISSLNEDDELILYAATKDDFIFVCKKNLQSHVPETNFFIQLENAAEIAKKNDSIAITCWDGAHNPLGRAKVLYDILQTQREPLLISYINQDFGSQIWEPMTNSKINHLQIPWQERDKYEGYIRELNISFDSIWICKNRYPSFLLADLFSHKDTSLILDIDDMEKEFSQGYSQRHKSYGRYTNNISNYYTDLISTKSSPSITLSNYYSSNIIRHTRFPKPAQTQILKNKSNIDIVFIGTARGHKNLVGLSERINEINSNNDKEIVFHVYGDVSSKDKKTMTAHGTKIYGMVSINELQDIISSYDVCISGYPLDEDKINEFQISSKIGDALSVSKPILVPEGSSVKDLENINGIYLFNDENFEEVLNDIILTEHKISFPDQFNTLKNYNNFKVLENLSLSAKKADFIFNKEIEKKSFETINSKIENVVFIWKQHDAGIYGRRIDIVARDYKKNNPNTNVFILQTRQIIDDDNFNKNMDSFYSDAKYILENVDTEIDNVNYFTIVFDKLANLESEVNKFLLSNKIFPSNSSIVIFPYYTYLETILNSLKSFKIIVDTVDNQLEWAQDKVKHRYVSQFTTIFNLAHAIIFNSDTNFRYFKDNGYINDKKKVAIIPNWYNFPPSFSLENHFKSKEKRDLKNIFYSGNLNDRFDWHLLLKIARKFPDIFFHLVGTSSHRNGWLDAINHSKNIIYHGPLKEKSNLKLLSKMDLSIMPHMSDNVSEYMNPLKVEMYKKLGIKTIAMSVNGITENKYLKIVDNHDDFIKEIEKNKSVHIGHANENEYKEALVYENILNNSK